MLKLSSLRWPALLVWLWLSLLATWLAAHGRFSLWRLRSGKERNGLRYYLKKLRERLRH